VAVSDSELALGFGESAVLVVRYGEEQPPGGLTPLPGRLIEFALVDDPGGSTLDSATAQTGAEGTASVLLSAGALPRLFRVRASAPAAADVDFGIAVTNDGVVDLTVQPSVAMPLVGAALVRGRLVAGDWACTRLGPRLSSPIREVVLPVLGGSAPATTLPPLSFRNLLGQGYAVEVQLETAREEPLARGCVDLPAEALTPGARLALPLPLYPESPLLRGVWQLTSVLQASPGELATLLAAWRRLGGCALGPASGLLDALEAEVGVTRRESIAARRGAADSKGCRPATVGNAGGPSQPSLDAALLVLLSSPSGASMGQTLAQQALRLSLDVESLTATARLLSTLSLDEVLLPPAGGGVAGANAAAPPRLLRSADHRLDTVELALLGGDQLSLELATSLRPLLVAEAVALELTAGQLQFAEQRFTLDLPAARAAAFEQLILRPRLPVAPSSPLDVVDLVRALIEVAALDGRTGCGAVEALICEGSPGCLGSVEPACLAAELRWAEALRTPFVSPPAGVDLVLEGLGLPVDDDADGRADRLIDGRWSRSGVARGTWTGAR
jgi:hypothetical protein